MATNSDLAVLMVNVARRPVQNSEDQAITGEFLTRSKLDLADPAAAAAFIAANRLEGAATDPGDGGDE